jgi:hypothetical protein
MRCISIQCILLERTARSIGSLKIGKKRRSGRKPNRYNNLPAPKTLGAGVAHAGAQIALDNRGRTTCLEKGH